MIFFDIYNKSSTINHQRYMALCYTPVQRDSLRIKRLHGVHRRNVKRFRGGLVFKADRLLYHSSLGLKVIKKKKKGEAGTGAFVDCVRHLSPPALRSVERSSPVLATGKGCMECVHACPTVSSRMGRCRAKRKLLNRFNGL